MDPLKSVLLQLQSNSKEISDETIRILIKIADNVIKEPTNPKLRSLQKVNGTVSKKILNVTGGLECLQLMGFEERGSFYVLPPNVSVTRLEKFRNTLLQAHNDVNVNVFSQLSEISLQDEQSDTSSTSSSDSEPSKGAVPKASVSECAVNSEINNSRVAIIQHDVPLVVLPPIKYIFNNPFLNQVELAFHTALSYADKDLQKRALAVIPKTKLEINAQYRLRKLQESAKKGEVSDFDYTIDDFLLLELLDWFKNEFFEWVDSPDCQYCNGNTSFAQMSADPNLLVHTNRVEMHKCHNCHQLTPFPRYNDVNILLLTRRGRCGEWANTFTLICCAMGWDARLVVDQTDHVWTEVFMHSQKRWLHCDPCENVCDTPLMYENGWGKQVSYVIAYSSEEVQDVTWRYSSNHKAVMLRRLKCAENALIDALIRLRAKRQENLTKARVEYLTNRVLLELVELMCEKNVSDKEKQGRTSGSERWRLLRGEIQPKVESYVFMLQPQDTESGPVVVRYSAALDKYEVAGTSGLISSLNGCHSGVFKLNDIFRKEEKDWKMVYLARTEGAHYGEISWKLELGNSSQTIDVLDVKLEHKLYENGKVDVIIENGNNTINMPQNTVEFRTSAFRGSKFVVITARLSGGKGEVAWQHAQLFRQSMSSCDYPFIVKCYFK